ncbi:MAG: carboxypeptidase regulatory-like domain-containing protein [Chitinophagales bacterium]|nr:carboxypeptidase regulatory-like domain-containing protein [Chitinophagales bacterium]
METNRFKCSFPDLYSASGMVIRAAMRHVVHFTALKPKYNLTYFNQLLNEVTATESIPPQSLRKSLIRSQRLQLIEQAKTCLTYWQHLKSYISDANAFSSQQLRPALKAAGLTIYSKAANSDWESIITLMNSGNRFMADNLAALTLNDNMPPVFPAQFNNQLVLFQSLHAQFLDTRKTTTITARQKLDAANSLYRKIIRLCKDGQRLFRHSPAIRQQFIWNKVLYQTRGAGSAGIHGTVSNNNNNQPVPNVTVQLLNTTHATISDPLGKYNLSGIAAGNYTLQFSAPGFVTQTIQFEILTGIWSILHISLQPVPG